MTTSFKLGRKPALIPAKLGYLTDYVAGSLPAAPASVTVPTVPAQSDGTPWGLQGNAEKGDCGPAGLDHGFMASASETSETEKFPTADQTVKFYLKYTGGEDSGVVLSQYLAYVRKHKFYGHSVSAYAPVAPHDVPTLQFAIDAYDFAYVGITVSNDMMKAVQGEGPWEWTLDDLGGGAAGGHCIILCGYDSNWLYGITWGQVIKIAYPAWHRMSDEAWAVITGEDVKATADGHGINLAALQADLDLLDK